MAGEFGLVEASIDPQRRRVGRQVLKDRKFYRVGEVWGTESECELTRRCSIERIVRAPGGVVV